MPRKSERANAKTAKNKNTFEEWSFSCSKEERLRFRRLSTRRKLLWLEEINRLRRAVQRHSGGA
jgi:hypothetical protein